MDCVDMVAFTYDADCHLGFCGDVYGGQGILGPLGAAVGSTFPRGADASMLLTTSEEWRRYRVGWVVEGIL